MTDYIVMFTVRNANKYPSIFELDEIVEAAASIVGVDVSNITDIDWEDSE